MLSCILAFVWCGVWRVLQIKRKKVHFHRKVSHIRIHFLSIYFENPPQLSEESEKNFISEIKNIIFNLAEYFVVDFSTLSSPLQSEIDIYFWRLYFASHVLSPVVGYKKNPFLSLSHRSLSRSPDDNESYLSSSDSKNGWSFSHSMNNKIRNFHSTQFLYIFIVLDDAERERERWWNGWMLLDGWREWTWLILVCSQHLSLSLSRFALVIINAIFVLIQSHTPHHCRVGGERVRQWLKIERCDDDKYLKKREADVSQLRWWIAYEFMK